MLGEHGSGVSASIAESCRRWPDRPALIQGGRTLTYAELDAAIRSLVAAYAAIGITPGDRIVCQLPPSPEHVIALGAAWASGAVHVGAHPDLTGTELAQVVTQTGATALLFQPRAHLPDPLEPLDAVRKAHPPVRRILLGTKLERGEHALPDLLARTAAASAAERPPADDETALLLRTSGTTGIPKAVMETLPAFWAKVQFFAGALRPGPDDTHLMYLPMSHAYGMKLSLMALATGGRLVLMDRFSPEQALQTIGRERVTVLPGTPTHFAILLRVLDERHHDVGSLRWVTSAAAPLLPALAAEMSTRLGVGIMHVYGCSEGFLTLTTDAGDIRRGSVGRTVFRGPPGSPANGTIAILDPDRDEVVAAGARGEIAYGADAPVRYWGEPPTAASGGWYRTGDLGWIDDEGRVFVRGRLKELVNRGGLKVACGEVEAALRGHRGIADCAVIPSPDPVLGEAICACVVPAAGAVPDLDELRASLAGVLARHKLPDELCVLDEIPHTSVGKIDRAALTGRVVRGGLPGARARH